MRKSAQRGGVARHRERRLDRCRSPRLHPWDTAGLQLGDDLVGDFGVKARAVVAGTDSCVCLDIAVLRDGRRRPLLRPSTRRGNPVRTLTLNGGDAARTSGEPGCASARLSLRQGWKPEG